MHAASIDIASFAPTILFFVVYAGRRRYAYDFYSRLPEYFTAFYARSRATLTYFKSHVKIGSILPSYYLVEAIKHESIML